MIYDGALVNKSANATATGVTEGMHRRVGTGLLATSGMKVLDSARTSVDRVYNGSRPCLGRANEVALKQEESLLSSRERPVSQLPEHLCTPATTRC